jgi:hypothetical protein
VFERVLLRIFGPKRDEVVEGWRRLHEELHNLYTSPSVMRVTIKEEEMNETCSTQGRYEKLIENFGRKTCREKTTWKT